MTQLIDKIAKLLYDGKRMTAREISAHFGTDVDHTRRMVKRLHRARQIHIYGWLKSAGGGSSAPIYMWGDAFDAEEPSMDCDEPEQKPETQSYATIAHLRTAFIPGQFDPFRVLRAQVSQ